MAWVWIELISCWHSRLENRQIQSLSFGRRRQRLPIAMAGCCRKWEWWYRSIAHDAQAVPHVTALAREWKDGTRLIMNKRRLRNMERRTTRGRIYWRYTKHRWTCAQREAGGICNLDWNSRAEHDLILEPRGVETRRWQAQACEPH
jgi:hypothetical protein